MGRLEWNRRVERDRNVLERILALLLALALLTDRAAGLPAARRMHLLAVLAGGEAMARDFILVMASEAGASARFDAASDAATVKLVPEAGDAPLLAARFRVLALTLGVLLAQARVPCRSTPPRTGLPRRKPRQSLQSTRPPAVRATSPPRPGES